MTTSVFCVTDPINQMISHHVLTLVVIGSVVYDSRNFKHEKARMYIEVTTEFLLLLMSSLM